MKRFLFLSVLYATTINAQTKKLNIIVDERMELLTTVQLLANYTLLTTSDIDYKKEVIAYFAPYKDYEAVKIISIIKDEFFAFHVAPTYIYHYSFPGFVQTSQFTAIESEAIDYANNKDTLNKLAVALKEFYEKSHFHAFYVKHKPLYDIIISSVRLAIGDKNIIKTLESYYGTTNHSYNVVLTPLLHDGGFGILTKSKKGNDLFAIIGPKFNSIRIPEFDSKTLLQNYVLHEFSHSFCNPLIDKYFAQLSSDSCLLQPIIESQVQQGYGDWQCCLYEHLVRANEIMLTKIIFGTNESDKVYNEYFENRKWIYLKGLVPLIENYNKNRNKYKTLNDFMSVIVSYFGEEKKNCK